MSTKRDLTRIRHNTKIVATLGPGSNNVELLEDMIRVGGLNVVRFNFSHGTAEFHQENARIVREAAKLIKGGGGGAPHFATAGGKDASGLEEAVKKVVDLALA